MELSDLYDEEFKIFALEYNTSSTEPNNELDHYVNTLQQHNEDFDPGINGMQHFTPCKCKTPMH
jgi:hypothetical protein